MFAHRPAPITPIRSSALAMPRASLRRRGAGSGRGARRRRRAARSPTYGTRGLRAGTGSRSGTRARCRRAAAACRGSTGGTWSSGSASGSERSSEIVYGWRGSVSSVRASASSTICPPYMTAIRSHISAITPRSWLTRIMLIPESRCSSSSRLRIWSWMITSSAVVGSSASRIRGLDAIAAAISTRCRMPPLNSCG